MYEIQIVFLSNEHGGKPNQIHIIQQINNTTTQRKKKMKQSKSSTTHNTRKRLTIFAITATATAPPVRSTWSRIVGCLTLESAFTMVTVR